ncbi:MAG: tRNA (adenine-N1)-methyltransferase, partial [Candidatus Caldatribacterium sp.]|nr:tRNA (adenine-N1)-methyltransferase [Candidatus Caldatribacterium sp.]
MPIEKGDRVYIWLEDGRDYLVRVAPEKSLGTHLGNIELSELLGKEFGEYVLTSKGKKAFLLQPGVVENVFHMRRRTQIVYPKDLGYILLMLDVKEGDRVIDVGLGSGAMCGALARLVGERGRVYAYERRGDFIPLAEENLREWGVLHRVTIHPRDIAEGFVERDVDALFLDVPEPWQYLKQCWDALRGGGRLAVVSPTAGQVMEVLRGLEALPFVAVSYTHLT